MIFTKKTMMIKYLNTSNPLQDIRKPLKDRESYQANGKRPIVPVYYARYIGVEKDITDLQYLSSIQDMIKALRNKGLNPIVFKEDLPLKDVPQDLLTEYKRIGSKYSNLNFDNLNQYINDLLNHKYINKSGDSFITATCEHEFTRIIHKYKTEEAHVNITMINSFIYKIFSWCVSYLPDIIREFHQNNLYNPKIIYMGNIRKHEEYFLTYLASIGCDVIYINPAKDYGIKRMNTSTLLINPTRSIDMKKVTIPKTVSNAPRTSTSYKPQSSSRPQNIGVSTEANNRPTRINMTRISKADFKNINVISNTESQDIFKDILKPIDGRIGFIQGQKSIVPTYFYKILGVSDNKDIYCNNLYHTDKSLSNQDIPYIRFDNRINLTNSESLKSKTNSIWTDSNLSKSLDVNNLIDLLNTHTALNVTSNNIMNNTIAKALNNALDIYKSTNTSVNLSQIKNVSLKLLTWIHEYIPKLFTGLTLTFSAKYNPKVIYFGDIKKHEGLFLTILHYIGCDVLYINPKGIDGLGWIPNIDNFTNLVVYNNKEDINLYPTSEVLVRNETVAFQASREIGEIIHNTTDGVFKPWQFEDYMIQPLTLKTTYDEVYILWREQPQIRNGFEIKDKTIYIPNIFCKVSGTHEDITTYWNEVKGIVNFSFTHFEEKVPFTNHHYSNSDMYAYDYLINRDGSLNKDGIKSCSIYNYGYLRLGLQNTILDKIEQLFNYNGFKANIDREYKKRVLYNILNLDKHIMELINKFDYPFGNPKLVIYDKDESMFSDDDIIVILFLNLMCFDIVIFTPTGYTNVEKDINQSKFDIHKLAKNRFHLDIPPRLLKPNCVHDDKKGFWSNLFGM